MEQEESAADLELLVFELGGARYALELSAVREVVNAVMIATLPDAPAVIEGIVDVRGQIVPVYDLRARFSLPSRPLSVDERMVIAWTSTRLVAFRCERTDWVEHVPRTLMDSADTARSQGRNISGVVRLPEGLVLIQNLDAFLGEAESEQLVKALSAHGDGVKA
jgi:purine-binding chemotaxis protein CheW